MRRSKSFISILMHSVSLLIVALALWSDVLAQNELLSPAAISDYNARLEKARNNLSVIDDRVKCLDKEQQALISRRDNLQIDLGKLRVSQHDLQSTNAQAKSNLDFWGKEIENEQIFYNALSGELNKYTNEKSKQENELQDCKRKFLSDPLYLCDFAQRIGFLVGAIQSVDGKIGESNRRLSDARDKINNAQRSFNESKTAYDKVTKDMKALDDSVLLMELEISQVAPTISSIHVKLQNYRELILDFNNALGEANEVDTADARAARTARKVARISNDADGAIGKFNDAELALPSKWRQKCSP